MARASCGERARGAEQDAGVSRKKRVKQQRTIKDQSLHLKGTLRTGYKNQNGIQPYAERGGGWKTGRETDEPRAGARATRGSGKPWWTGRRVLQSDGHFKSLKR